MWGACVGSNVLHFPPSCHHCYCCIHGSSFGLNICLPSIDFWEMVATIRALVPSIRSEMCHGTTCTTNSSVSVTNVQLQTICLQGDIQHRASSNPMFDEFSECAFPGCIATSDWQQSKHGSTVCFCYSNAGVRWVSECPTVLWHFPYQLDSI